MTDGLQKILKLYQEKVEELDEMIAAIKAIEDLELQFIDGEYKVLDLRKIELNYGDKVWFSCPNGYLEQVIVPEPSTCTDWEAIRRERQA